MKMILDFSWMISFSLLTVLTIERSSNSKEVWSVGSLCQGLWYDYDMRIREKF